MDFSLASSVHNAGLYRLSDIQYSNIPASFILCSWCVALPHFVLATDSKILYTSLMLMVANGYKCLTIEKSS